MVITVLEISEGKIKKVDIYQQKACLDRPIFIICVLDHDLVIGLAFDLQQSKFNIVFRVNWFRSFIAVRN